MPLSGLDGVLMRQEIQWCFVPDLSCMVFLSHLPWCGWAINWVYFALLRICVLQWLPTHHPKKKLCSRGSYSASTCRWNMLYGWSPLLTLRKWLLLQIAESEKLFIGVFENSFLLSRILIAEKRLLSVWMIHVPFKLNPLYWIIWQLFCGWFEECLFFSFSIRNNKTL